MVNKNKSILYVIIIIIIFALSFFLGKRSVKPINTIITQIDSVIFRDTIKIIEPKEVDRYITRTELIKLTDTLLIIDTLYVLINIESVEYKSDDYRVLISGFKPSLDLIEVYPKTVYVNNYVKEQTKFSLFLDGGVQCYKELYPYIGIGIEYNINPKFSVYSKAHVIPKSFNVSFGCSYKLFSF